MGDRVTVGGLQVAPVLHAFVRDEALPGSGIDEAAFWSGVEAILADFAPRNRDAAGPPRRAPAAARRVAHRSTPARSATRRRTSQMLREIGYLVDEPADFTHRDQRRRRRGRRPGRARSWSCRCSTRGSRPTPPTPAGARSTTRSTAPTRSPRTTARSAASSYNPTRGAAVIARARALPRRALPAGSRAATPTRRGYADRGRRAARSRCGDGESALADPSQYVGHRGDPADPEGVLLVHHGLHVEIQVDRAAPDRQGRRRRGQGPAAGVRGLHDHGPRGLGRRGRRRRQGRRLPQLAPAQPGHAHRRGRQGRQSYVHPPARAGPDLRRAAAARSCCPAGRCSSSARSAT